MQGYLGAVAYHALAYAAVPALLPTVPPFTGGVVVGSAFYASWKSVEYLLEGVSDRFRIIKNVMVVALGCLGSVGASYGAFACLGVQVALPQLAAAALLPVGSILLLGGVIRVGTPIMNKVWSAACESLFKKA